MPRAILCNHRLPALFTLLLALAALPAAAGINRWTPVGPDGGIVRALAQDPIQPKTLYAGADFGVWKSLDRGHSWAPVTRVLTADQAGVMALVVDPQSPSTVYAGTVNGIIKSVDGGASWSLLSAPRYVQSLAIDPQNPSVLYAGPIDAGTWKTSDGGTTWQPANAGFERADVQSIAVDPVTAGTVYATFLGMGKTGVYKSVDGGATWSPTDAGLPHRPFQRPFLQIVIDPSAPARLYVAFGATEGPNGAVFRSTDAGVSWTRLGPNAGFPLAVGKNGELYAGSGRSYDGGATFYRGKALGDLVTLLSDALFPDIVFAATNGHGVKRSSNGGDFWVDAGVGLRATDVAALAVDPSHAGWIYASIFQVGFEFSLQGGDVWHPGAADLRAVPPGQLIVDPRNSQTLYATSLDSLTKSTDGGLTFGPLHPPQKGCSTLLAAALDPSSGTLYAGGEADSRCDGGCDTFRSTNGGASWHCMSLPSLHSIAVSPAAPFTLYAATREDSLVKSVDHGATWVPIAAGLTGALEGVTALGLDPADAKRLFAATPSGVFRTTDGGATWTAANSGLPSGTVDALVVDPRTPQRLYAAITASSAGEVYRSEDGGATWLIMSGGLPPGGLSGQLVLDPHAPDTLYAGTGAGVYRFTRVGK